MVLGHSSINVSLTWLMGLEVPELTEGDMPIILVRHLKEYHNLIHQK